MARVAFPYTTFGRGEVSPLMLGRIDIDQYVSCLEKCRNCWIRPYGNACRIPGSQFVNQVKNNSNAKLLKFVFSATDAYMIEAGAGYFRFYNDGAVVIKSEAGEWATGTEYKKGDFCTFENLMYYCLETHTAAAFSDDLSSGKWIQQNIYEVPNNFTESQIESIQYVQLDDIIKFAVLPDGDNSTARLTELVRNAPDDWEFREVPLKNNPYLDENTTGTTLKASGTTGNITIDASGDVFKEGHIGSFWWLGGTVAVNDVDTQGFVKITGFTNARKVNAAVQSQLSTTNATTRWGEAAWSDVRGYPSCVALYDGRIYYARTPNSPRNIYGSRPYSYETFTPAVDNEDDGAINIQLATNASGDGSDIKWLIGGSYLMCGTYGGEFVIRGTGDGAITPTDVSARQRTNWGGERVQPLSVGSFVHFVQRCGQKLRQFQYDYYYDTYKGVDVSIFSEHFLRSGVKQLAYLKNPDSMLVLTMNNGDIVLLTLEQDQSVLAWSLLQFKGNITSSETIPSFNGYYDELWYIIERNINGQKVKYIERIQDLITPDIQQDCWYVRSGLSYSAYDLTKNNNLTLSGTSGVITVTAQNSVFESDMINKRIRVIDENANILGQAVITGYTDDKTVTAKVIKEFNSTSYTGGSWGISVNEISGLNHLEGETVQILADGAEQTQQTVDNGKIRLELNGWKLIIGLGYQSYITTLPLEAGSQNGTAIGKRKRIHEMALRVWKTLGCRVGKSLNEKDLYEVKYREPQSPLGTAPELYTGIIPNIKYNQGWTWEANITVEQSHPFPMNILAIAPIMTEVDK